MVLGERETRQGMLYSGGDSDCIVHKVRLTLVTRTRHMDWPEHATWTGVTSGAGSCHFTVRTG